MKPDRRKPWRYGGYTIIPVDTQPPSWGKCGEPFLDLKTGQSLTRYWRVEISNHKWKLCGTKEACRAYIFDNLSQ